MKHAIVDRRWDSQLRQRIVAGANLPCRPNGIETRTD
jgi:hypothetical protein